MKGKNKLVPRLLGITKECVMRVDEKTKEVIQEWNLTNIKRWAASPKSFTLVSLGAPREGLWNFQRMGSRRGLPTSLGAGVLNVTQTERRTLELLQNMEGKVKERLLGSEVTFK